MARPRTIARSGPATPSDPPAPPLRLGVDFGTTRTLVACVDRGNFPVVSFVDVDGESVDHVPSLAAVSGGRVLYGLEAAAAARAGAPTLRSFKRLLAARDVTAHTPVVIGDVTLPLLDVLTGFLAWVRRALLTTSNAPGARASSRTEAVVAVPAHAHGAQRYLTLEAFTRAGFDVVAMLHEPSAAGFEYTHRQPKSVSSKRTRVVVYDLGGGTFDASLVSVRAHHHEVLATAGDNHLGGDDIDAALLTLATANANVDIGGLDPVGRAQLLERCREAKERLTPHSRRVSVELFGVSGLDSTVHLSVADFTAAVEPLIERSIATMAPIVGALDGDVAANALVDVAGIYLVGGQSALPMVSRLLKERFGRRVHRSPYPAASVAIGLAIACAANDDDAFGFTLTDRFSRCFGVFREGDGGASVRFDTIFAPSTTLPRVGGAVHISRRYRAVHNVGHYRFVECTRLDEAGEPSGDVVPFGAVLFPFDKTLRGVNDDALAKIDVARSDVPVEVEERYTIDDRGAVTVTLIDVATGYERQATLGRRSP